ncbi:MAG: hypothetical protein ACRD1X_14155 [Vicinamibacteria bacterium]
MSASMNRREYLRWEPGKPMLTVRGTDEMGSGGLTKGAWVQMVLPGKQWLVSGRMEVEGDRVVVAELRLFSLTDKVPEAGISQKVVRRVPFGLFRSFALSMANYATKYGFRFLEEPIKRELPGLKVPPRPRPRRSAGLDDLYYAKLADHYIKAITKRGSRTPVADLAAVRGETPETIRDRVHEARVRGLLSKSEPGRMGGVLLPRGLDLLGIARKRKTAKQPKTRAKEGRKRGKNAKKEK